MSQAPPLAPLVLHRAISHACGHTHHAGEAIQLVRVPFGRGFLRGMVCAGCGQHVGIWTQQHGDRAVQIVSALLPRE